jgi:hypothetical protein
MADDMDIELPLVKVSKEDVYGALFVHTNNMGELYHDSLMKLQTWIMTYAEDVVKPLRESGKFTDEYIDSLKRKTCVISPLTLTLYLHWLQMEQFSKMPDSQKEKILLEKLPDRFRARYKGNAACRNAREVSPDEETIGEDGQSETEVVAHKRRMTFVEFLKEFGEEVKQNKTRG